MNDVSQDAYDVKYPWQSPVLEAVREFDSERLAKKIVVAEDAIAKRQAELNGAADQEETHALDDAQSTLKTLKRQHRE
jgi:hypothetical protein